MCVCTRKYDTVEQSVRVNDEMENGDTSAVSNKGVKMSIVYVCHAIESFGIVDTGLSTETIRAAKVTGDANSVSECSLLITSADVMYFLRFQPPAYDLRMLAII